MGFCFNGIISKPFFCRKILGDNHKIIPNMKISGTITLSLKFWFFTTYKFELNNIRSIVSIMQQPIILILEEQFVLCTKTLSENHLLINK
jgi:hypothetical protein